MKTMLALATVLVLAPVAVVALGGDDARADRKAATPDPRAAATLKKIEATLGFVPAFARAVPPALLPSWWDAIVSFEDGPDTKLDAKTKQLIALAVSAQVPCEYCAYYHTEAARLHGASEQELQEAVGMAAGVRLNSTIVNGMQVDKAQFRRDVDRMFRAARQLIKK